MLKYFRFLLSLVLIILFSQEVMATHVPGGNITYECLGGNNYIITLTVFEDCSGSVSVPILHKLLQLLIVVVLVL